MNNFQFYNFFFPDKSHPNSTTMIGLVKNLSAPTSYKRKFVTSGGITTQGNTGLIVVIDIYRFRGGVNII